MFLNCLLLLFLFTFCTSRDTITITQTVADGDIVISREASFALGFFSPGKSRYRYLGIWFYKVSEQTVVWVANRDNPINGSSGVLSINQDGKLALYHSHGQNFPVWSTNVSVEVADSSVAQLLDTGNLVLFQNGSKRVLWQSFDYPTDTALPDMEFGLNRKTGLLRFLTSWKSPDDPGTGEYSTRLNPNGSPQFFSYKDSTPYWRYGPHPWIVRPMEDYNFSYANNQNEIYYSYRLIDTSVITRVFLDNSGILKRVTWQNGEKKWKEFWSAPYTRCERYGHCGANSNCNPNNIDRFECTCLPGYEPKFPNNWRMRDGSSGCVGKRTRSSSVCGNEEGFLKVKPVKVPDTAVAVQTGVNMSIAECEKACLRNCSCTAYANLDFSSKEKVCLAWYGELMDTLLYLDDGYDLYVRVDAIELAEHARNSKSFLERKGMLAILLSSIALTLFPVVLVACLLLRKKRKTKGLKKRRSKNESGLTVRSTYFKDTLLENELVERSDLDLPFFDLDTIFAATNRFSTANKLGQGGFGSVYKGQLPNGQEIAVKRLSNSSQQGIEEFRNEVLLIAKLQHRNLVRLLGCCIEGEEKILIYEYLPNKSLDSFLFNETRRPSLDWSKRFNIIVGIARGILYLHEDSRLRIIHRDLKTSNILLDMEMNAKISDFGMARIFKGNQVQDKTTRVVGTYGYMSPEYVVFGKFSPKSDVYSFGVILLEIICGKKINRSYQEGLCLSLIGHVWNLWKEDRVLDIIDPSLKDSYVPHEVLRCIQIGLLCVQDDAKDRPTMSSAVLMLNGETALPSPKQPAFTLKNSSDGSNSLVARRSYSINKVTITGVEAR